MTAFDHALIRGCKPDKPFLLLERTPSLVNWHEDNKLKRPGLNRMSAIQTVACGADGVQYCQWRKMCIRDMLYGGSTGTQRHWHAGPD